MESLRLNCYHFNSALDHPRSSHTIRMADQLYKNRNQTLIAIIRSFVANEPQYTQEEIVVLRDSNSELRKIGVNLNQIAHRTNSIDFDRVSDGETVKELLKRMIKRTEDLSNTIDEHVAKVWAIINAGRYRKDLMKEGVFL